MCSNSLRESSKTHFDSIVNNVLLDSILAKCMLSVLLNYVSFTIFYNDIIFENVSIVAFYFGRKKL